MGSTTRVDSTLAVQARGGKEPIQMLQVRRVYGPYKARDKFRLVFLMSSGERRAQLYATRREALDEMQRHDLDRGVTVQRAIDEYLLDCADAGTKRRSLETTRIRLTGLLASVLAVPVQSLTRARCTALIKEYAASRSGDTVLNTLGQTRTWGRWVCRQGWQTSSPWEDVEIKRKRNRGKPQLRVTELRALVDFCLQESSKASTALLCCLLLGLRASEVCKLRVRDLDDGGRLVWIEEAKTEAGNRTLEVPEILGALLQEQAKGRGPNEQLLAGMTRYALHHHVLRLCRQSGVPRVCPHSLRGAHATLARVQGAASKAVAQALGHSSDSVTNAHYTNQEAVMRAVLRRVV